MYNEMFRVVFRRQNPILLGLALEMLQSLLVYKTPICRRAYVNTLQSN